MSFKIGDRVIIKTHRQIKTAKNLICNDIVEVTGIMARGGYGVSDSLGMYLGIVRKSDIKLH